MRKMLAAALFMLLTLSAFADETTVKMGRLTALSVEDARFAALSGGARAIVGFDSLPQLLRALEDGGVDYILLPRFAANYAAARNAGLTVIPKGAALVSYRMATTAENVAMRDILNAAICALREEGTLSALSNSWLGTQAADPVSIAMPMAEGETGIRVGVTGDLPPMDFIASDGTPAGFNASLMTLIADKAGLVVEFVPISSGERETALAEGRIDACFWAQTPDEKNIALDGETLCLTEAYYSCEIAHVVKDFGQEQVREIEGMN